MQEAPSARVSCKMQETTNPPAVHKARSNVPIRTIKYLDEVHAKGSLMIGEKTKPQWLETHLSPADHCEGVRWLCRLPIMLAGL